MGLQARLMSQALRKLTGTISKTMTSVIFINQIREKMKAFSGFDPVEIPKMERDRLNICLEIDELEAVLEKLEEKEE